MNLKTSDGFLTEYDLHLWRETTHYKVWEKMGAHPTTQDGRPGVHFAVWAPNADRVSVVGDFNGWDESAHPMAPLADAGVWVAFVPGVENGALYKYSIHSQRGDYHVLKSDPFAFAFEKRPSTSSLVTDIRGYEWNDAAWMRERGRRNRHDAPISIYEVHLGSWRRKVEEENRWLSYTELAEELAAYVREMGYTHVEFLPISEHPLDGSWGYQTIGYFAPTSRFGTAHEFMRLVDTLHQNGIGVILDWVPAHFPRDQHGLGFFDGTHLYEHDDPRQGVHQDWGTFVFNYGRDEVRSFLLSNALYWLDEYHLDGLRVDAVASMLYLDYSRKEGEWVPNRYGGRENLEAVDFLKRFNTVVYERHPDIMTIAEESTAWPMVSRPVYLGGLGFGMKWNMGWMHDVLSYVSHDPIFRKYRHNELTFSMMYAFHESFVLPFSHDEVVHGKGSMMGKMPGDEWRRFANLRTLYGYMFGHPGKKLMFMGCEFGQWREWDHETSLDWHLLAQPTHRGLQRWVRDLNTLLRGAPALYERDTSEDGFQWIDCHDSEQSVVSFIRWDSAREDPIVCVCNFTPVPRPNYRLGVPRRGEWIEVLNSDARLYGGSGQGNLNGVRTTPVAIHGHYQSINVTVPPLGTVLFRLAEHVR